MRTNTSFDTSGAGPLARAQGCLMGQVAGDSLGSLVEFQGAASIERQYPGGPRLLRDGGVWNTVAGQPTDDSELALALARSLALDGNYDEQAVARSYAAWYASGPFDVGTTTGAALAPAAAADKAGRNAAAAAKEQADPGSQSNGALMRVSPLGVFGVRLSAAELARCARSDASLTHPHRVCQDSNAVYTAAIAFAIRTGGEPQQVYEHVSDTIQGMDIDPTVSGCVQEAESRPPAEYERNQGWVLIALQNAFYRLLHAPAFEDGVVETVRRGGDTDTNAAIAGALLGAVWGIEAVPRQWLECVLNCRPERGRGGVYRPRPQEYWPVDILTLASQLLG